MKRHGDYIDAEFEVVHEPERTWNGLGLPPEWGEWGWFPRTAYVLARLWFLWWTVMIGITVHSIATLLLQP